MPGLLFVLGGAPPNCGLVCWISKEMSSGGVSAAVGVLSHLNWERLGREATEDAKCRQELC